MLGRMSGALEQRVSSPPVTVRDVLGIDELLACQDLQRRAWGITEDGYILPVATMAGAQRVGGVILGAFGADNRLIGFAFAYLGRFRDEWILYSQLTGVHPAQQRTGVGRVLKYEQRRRAREVGLAAVVWAFDPLQASNAGFNLAVLGATCRTYEVDMYGSRSDTLNAGLVTDRLLAEWSTAGEPTGGQTEPWTDTYELIETRPAPSATSRLADGVRPVPAGARHLSIECPANLTTVKTQGPADAVRQWQLAHRAAFQAAFDAGFVSVGFSRGAAQQPCYLLERAP
jgi:predicted GNAT superfamily acetyltransferase